MLTKQRPTFSNALACPSCGGPLPPPEAVAYGGRCESCWLEGELAARVIRSLADEPYDQGKPLLPSLALLHDIRHGTTFHAVLLLPDYLPRMRPWP
jgi:hypothetical protein